jgi:CRISPR/Cas system CSM-associated protein Csm3 (group 7 of RAMP superfamily)
MLDKVAVLDLRCQLQTPFLVRGKQAYSEKAIQPKLRSSSPKLVRGQDSEKPIDKKKWSELTDFNLIPFVKDGILSGRFQIPSSSIRGAMRSWASSQIFSLSELETLLEDDCTLLLDQVEMSSLKASFFRLFGNATPERCQKGSMTVSVSPFRTGDDAMDSNFAWLDSDLAMHILTRSPIDRITQAVYSTGPHSVLEISSGAEFYIQIQIENPSEMDMKLVNGLIGDMDLGMLRFGGLTSNGRGRVRTEVHSISEEMLGTTLLDCVFNEALISCSEVDNES